MYRFQTAPVEGASTSVVYIHPNFTEFGLGLKIYRDGEMNVVECQIVTGTINGQSSLNHVSDHTIPLDVQIWCFTAMRVIRDSVNTKSIDLNTLFSNHGGLVDYSHLQGVTS